MDSNVLRILFRATVTGKQLFWRGMGLTNRILRKLLHTIGEIASMEFLLDKMKSTKSNDEFFASMKR